MKKLFAVMPRVYGWLKTLPPYYLIPLLLFSQFVVTFILSALGIMDMTDKGDASFDKMGAGELILLACIFAPLAETLISQFVIIELILYLGKGLRWLAVIASALQFGLMHKYSGSYVVFSIAMGFMLALGYVVSRDKKGRKYAYWVVVVIHLAWNTMGVISRTIS